jgi:ElaB/YqjD/DUF883 family membrane-anchored ribosome-binding protein
MTATPRAAGGTADGTAGGAAGGAASKAAQGNSKRPSDVETLRREIAQTRAELGETVQALAAKADVKARLQETADDAKARVREGLQNAAVEAKSAAAAAPERAQALAVRTGRAVRSNPVPFVVAAGAVALVVLFVRWRRSR